MYAFEVRSEIGYVNVFSKQIVAATLTGDSRGDVNMNFKTLALVSLATLAACSTVVDEKTTTAVLRDGFYAGTQYQIRTRTMQGANGTYTQTSVVYNGVTAVCIPDSPGDCENAARNLIDGIYVRSER